MRLPQNPYACQPRGQKCFLVGLSVAYAVVMLSLCGGVRLYSLSPYHRLQADALLHGHLFIGDSLAQLGPGLAWHNGHVQQVWGLGIGLWLLPFQAIWKLFGWQMFPDRVALGVAFTLFAYYLASTGLKITRNGDLAFGLGFMWLVLLCPPLWTLARASQLVFEETVLYGIIISLGILVGLVRVAYFNSRADYRLLCALAALSGFVRPTLAIYGLSGVLIAPLLLYRRHQLIMEIAVGIFGFLAALVLLGIANQLRFGSALEFGHHLTVNSDSMVYMTRFGNPYSETGTASAANELIGLLFLDSKIRDAGAYSDNLFPGQASTIRWRRLYLTLFDPIYALLCLVAICGFIFWFARRWKSRRQMAERGANESDAMIAALFLWAGIAITGLVWFYLRTGVVASRYLLDFLPAFTALLVVAWLFISRLFPRLSLPLLAGWLLYELATAIVPAASLTAAPQPELALPRAVTTPLAQYQGGYSLSQHPALSGIAFNGHGWDPDAGFAGDIITLAVDQPQFIELHVSERRGINGQQARKDIYQAKMDGKTLSVRSATPESDGEKVVFEVPSKLQKGQQLVFLCFSGGYDAEDRDSERFLYSVRWR